MDALRCSHAYICSQDFDINDGKSSVESEQRDGCNRRTSLLLGVDPTGTAAMPQPSETANSQSNGGTTIPGRTADGGVSEHPTMPEGVDGSSPTRPVLRARRSVEAGLQPVHMRYATCWGECVCVHT